MPNHITKVIERYISTDDTVLDICSGIGNVTDTLKVKKMTVVDIFKPYLDVFKQKRPDIEIVELDVKNIMTIFSRDSFDIVMCLDGIEHLYLPDSIRLIENMELIARKKILIFTPEAITGEILPNFIHNAWGINGGDEYQTHKSGFKRDFFEKRKYKIIEVNVYSVYREMLYVFDKSCENNV